MKIQCGFVAVVGKPNAGKSTLTNALTGEKVSIVSPKPQTTRNNILGIYNDEKTQIVFVDTPGINAKNTGLDDFMQKSIKGATADVCCVVVCCDITKDLTKLELDLIENYSKNNIPVIIALTKIDLVPDLKIFEVLSKYSHLAEKSEIVPVSAHKHRNEKSILEVIKRFLPEVDEKDRYFEEDMYTDKPLKFLVAETIREKALFLLDHEIPHGIAVAIESFSEDESLAEIDACIVCDKDSHKAIILGKQGQMIKKIGHNARVSIQKMLQKKVVLNLFVKVKPNWKNNLEFLSSLGYNVNEI
ncbi:MAG: GTPase Era [Clostridia bacterium]|nr:GTPase Era [Clostridia bacterium]